MGSPWKNHSRVLASIRIQSWLSDLCLSAQGWTASRRCSRAQNPSLFQREAWPLSTALPVIVMLTTSGGTDSTLGKAPRCWCLSSPMVKRKKADSQFTSIKPACILPCTSETPSPVTLLSTSVQWAHSASQTPAACMQTYCAASSTDINHRPQSWRHSVSYLYAVGFMSKNREGFIDWKNGVFFFIF